VVLGKPKTSTASFRGVVLGKPKTSTASFRGVVLGQRFRRRLCHPALTPRAGGCARDTGRSRYAVAALSPAQLTVQTWANAVWGISCQRLVIGRALECHQLPQGISTHHHRCRRFDLQGWWSRRAAHGCWRI
jgi:hypothetical protein